MNLSTTDRDLNDFLAVQRFEIILKTNVQHFTKLLEFFNISQIINDVVEQTPFLITRARR